MLAKPVDTIPSGDYVFEPKWDGFRSIVFRNSDEVEIGSRNERPMSASFPSWWSRSRPSCRSGA